MADKTDIRVTRLDAAIDEAHRFLRKAKQAREELTTSQWTSTTVHYSGAKRASMDLTRALSNVRRSPYA